MDVLLVAAKKDLIDDYVHVITDAGLQPVILDVAAFAVENAFEAELRQLAATRSWRSSTSARRP